MQRYIGYDLEENDNGAYYLVEEVDKVITEKDKEIKDKDALLYSYKSANKVLSQMLDEKNAEIEQLKEEKEHLYFIANAGTHM